MPLAYSSGLSGFGGEVEAMSWRSCGEAERMEEEARLEVRMKVALGQWMVPFWRDERTERVSGFVCLRCERHECG
jgi:hypothetical protein